MSVINTVAGSAKKSVGNKLSFFQKGRRAALTLDELDKKAGRLALALKKLGLQRGDRIGLIARNGIEWILLDLAAIKGGFVTAGFEFGRFQCNPGLIARYGLKAVYADGKAERHDAIDLSEAVRNIAADTMPIPDEERLDARGTIEYAPNDITTIKFTSGSTGEPKGLCATVGSIDSSLKAVQSLFNHRNGDDLLVFLPLSLLQQRYWIYSALVYRHDVTITSYEFAFETAKETKPTVVMGVPGFFDGIKKRVETGAPAAKDDLAARRSQIESLLGNRIRYLWTGSAPANTDMLSFFNDCGIPIFEGYGMNETCIVSKNYPGAQRLGSVGKLLPNKRATIDADGVLIIGSDYPVNTHYAYCAPGDNQRIFLPGGDVRTGDLARIDEDGYLYILGRADDVVVLANGKYVHTRKLEEKVKSHTAVGECVLFGSGKPYLVAVVSPAALPCDDAAISDHIRKINEQLNPAERIVKTFIAREPFTMEGGLLTSQYKPKRKEIYKVFETEIECLYGGHA